MNKNNFKKETKRQQIFNSPQIYKSCCPGRLFTRVKGCQKSALLAYVISGEPIRV